MGLFEKVTNDANTVEEKDFVPGQKREPLPSDIYNLIIKYVYGEKAKSGAIGIHCLFEVADGDYAGRQLRITEYISSSDAKNNRTYYERKTANGMEKVKLPGYKAMGDLAELVVGKDIQKCNTEQKTINLYNFEKKAEVPTKVEMFVELLNKGIRGCVVNEIQDKETKNTQTGEYEPTGQTKNVNAIHAYLSASDYRTASEVRHNLTADYKEIWLKKWKDKVNDRSSQVKNNGSQGAPVASGNAAEKSDLFV